MDLSQITSAWIATLGRLGFLTITLGILTLLMPCNPGMYWWTRLRGFLTDLVYWFIVPLFTRMATLGILALCIGWLYRGAEPNLLPVSELPLWLQLGLILIIQDILLYWIHRWFHADWAWKFHAIHHSSKILDWVSTSRFHPVNQIISFSIVDVFVLLLGFRQENVACLAIFNVAYSAFVHANLNWDFGSFRYVLASPIFHRWHHTTEEEGLDKNFASTFPILDIMFGTYYMPKNRLPERFGTGNNDVPESFLGQLIYPFRWSGDQRMTVFFGRLSLGILSLAMTGLGGLIVFVEQENTTEMMEKKDNKHSATEVNSLRFQLNTKVPVLSVAMSADGRYVAATGMDGSVTRWEPATQTVWSYPAHIRSAKTVSMNADGSRLVSGGYDRYVRLLNAIDRQIIASRQENSGVLGVAISADGQQIASCSADGTIQIWKSSEPSFPRRIRVGETLPGIGMSPDGSRIASAGVDGLIRIWDTENGKQEYVLRGPARLAFCVALSNNCGCITAGSQDGFLRVWDGKTGQMLFVTQAHTEGILGVSITPDGKLIATGSADGLMKMWNGRTGADLGIFKQHLGGVSSVSICANGRWAVSGGLDSTVKVWSLATLSVKSSGAEEATGQ